MTTVCPSCHRAHAWIRLNLTITCTCGAKISRSQQLAQRALSTDMPR